MQRVYVICTCVTRVLLHSGAWDNDPTWLVNACIRMSHSLWSATGGVAASGILFRQLILRGSMEKPLNDLNWWYSHVNAMFRSGFPWISQLAMFDYQRVCRCFSACSPGVMSICSFFHRCGFDLWFVSTWLVILGVPASKKCLSSNSGQRRPIEQYYIYIYIDIDIDLSSSWKLLFWAIDKRFRKHNATCDKK